MQTRIWPEKITDPMLVELTSQMLIQWSEMLSKMTNKR